MPDPTPETNDPMWELIEQHKDHATVKMFCWGETRELIQNAMLAMWTFCHAERSRELMEDETNATEIPVDTCRDNPRSGRIRKP